VVSLILVDTNLLIYAFISSMPQHPAARDWFDRQLSGSTRVGLPWSSLLGFLRVVTNPRVLSNPPRTPEAWEQVTSWLSRDVVWIPQPTERHVDILGRLLALPGVRASLVPDADLAALAIEHGLILCSNDNGFARFPGLRWQNPLAA
jgi:toxin-antitoxin system PIN domain toxin